MANDRLKHQQNEIRELVNKALADNFFKGLVDLGKISKYQALKIRAATGFKLEGYRRIVTADEIRHCYRQHGDPITESKRGQLAVTAADFEMIPLIIHSNNIIYSGKSSLDNLDVLLFEHVINNKFFYSEVVRTGKHQLAFRSMYKRK